MSVSEVMEYPLDWPAGVLRTSERFAKEGLATEYESILAIKSAFRSFGVRRFTISTNDRFFGRMISRRNPPPPKLPFADRHGCAVYFARKSLTPDGFETRDYCICSDSFLYTADNVAEIARVVQKLASLRRSVSEQSLSQLLRSIELTDEYEGENEEPEQSHNYDEELFGPEPEQEKTPEPESSPEVHRPSEHSKWYRVLGLRRYPRDLKEAEACYRSLILTCHPDRGGTEEDAAALNGAIASARSFYGNVDREPDS